MEYLSKRPCTWWFNYRFGGVRVSNLGLGSGVVFGRGGIEVTTLREAREKGKLDEFIKEHKGDPKGDPEAFNRAVRAMAQTSKEAPKASSRRNRGG